MSQFDELADGLCASLARFDHVVEIAIGHRTDLAQRLHERGVTVTATDIHTRAVPQGVRFVRDDVFDPTISVYETADCIYARNLPPELHRPALDIARRIDAPLCFTTLGGDQPTIPVTRTTTPTETVFLVTD